MKAFEHVNALSTEEAVMLLASNGNSRVIAGGTDLLPQMKAGIVKPDQLVNLKSIPGLEDIDFDEKDGLRLGALATLESIASSKVVSERYGSLARAIGLAASPQLRNFATVGGSLVQGSRCWYYRGYFQCWLKGGQKCYAREGENRQHAIFYSGACHTVHPSDPATALVALKAEVEIAGGAGRRTVDIVDFFHEPTVRSRQLTTLSTGEIITEVRIPTPLPNSRSTYVKAMDRRVWSFAIVSVGASLTFQGDIVTEASLVLGGVAPSPWVGSQASESLVGNSLTLSSINRAAELSVAGARPLEQNGYKIALIKGLVNRALTDLKP